MDDIKLTKDEIEIISAYRKMNAEGQSLIRRRISEIIALGHIKGTTSLEWYKKKASMR